jgi:hypothetical protein
MKELGKRILVENKGDNKEASGLPGTTRDKGERG